MQVKTSVYLKAFSTLIFNAGQIIPKKQHICRLIILPLNLTFLLPWCFLLSFQRIHLHSNQVLWKMIIVIFITFTYSNKTSFLNNLQYLEFWFLSTFVYIFISNVCKGYHPKRTVLLLLDGHTMVASQSFQF